MSAQRWLLLAASLPGPSANTARVRLWRTLKEIGGASLRDGLTLVPASNTTRLRLVDVIAGVEGEGGSAWLFEMGAQADETETKLLPLFDRSPDYDALEAETAELGAQLKRLDEAGARKRLGQLERALESIVRTDFFPGARHARATDRLAKLRARVDRRFSPEEPVSAAGSVVVRDPSAFRGQRWATRKRLWVDRAASAWLIRGFIDGDAKFVWLDRPAQCPPDAHGFDFDGAAFTHVGELVTFQVLAASFGLDEDAGLARIGALVHYLDVGGEPIAEAAGFEAVLAGFRESCPDDDALLAEITPVLDSLYRHFGRVRP